MKPHRLTTIFISAVLSASSLSSSFGQIANGLLNYWNFEGNFNDSAGTAVGSTSTTNDNGTPASAAVTIQSGGLLGQYGQFARGHVVVPNSDDILAGGESLSISAWFRVTAFDTEWQALIAHGEGSDYRIARRTTNPVMAYAGGTGDIPGAADGPDVTDGAWHQVVAISEAGVSSRIWMDGTLVATGGAPNVTNNGSANLWIGANPDASGRDWNGDIDDVAMWDRPLTDEEIGDLYTKGLAGMPLSSQFVINTLPTVGTATLTGQTIDVTFTDGATSQVDVTKPRSMLIDGVDATPTTISKNAAVTTLSYTSPVPYPAGSLHSVQPTVTTTNNTPVTATRSVRAPFVSNTVGGAKWVTEQVWTHGNPTLTLSEAENQLNDPSLLAPEDQITVKTTYIHFDDNAAPPIYGPLSQPFPLWDPVNGGPGRGDRDDFAIRSREKIFIINEGKCWFICNSDDGFVLRIDGADVGTAGDRGRANTVMGVDLTAGPHDVEFIFYERAGGAGVSVFVHKGISDVEPPFDEGSYELLQAWLNPADSDGDGMTDVYEAENGLNPAVNDAALDKDGDGLTNLQEFQRGTRADLVDTDGDGLNDNVETNTGTYVSATNTGTNPLVKDTDADGLGDAVENNTGTFVDATHTGTSPFKADNDNDGVNDGAEVTLGTNPNDPASIASVIQGGGTFTTQHVWTRSNPTLTLASAEGVLDDPSPYPPEDQITTQTTFIHFNDNSPAPWFQAQERPFPLWDPVNGGAGLADRDDFAIRSRGTIKITKPGTVWFDCNSDDGFSLRIDGTEIGTAGDRGRTDSLMSADLTAGLHEVELIYYERAGGAALSVLVYRAISDTAPTSVNGSTWQLLEAFPAQTPSNLAITSFTYNQATSVLNLTFTSEAGANYALEYTTGFLPAGAPTSAQKWNVVTGYGAIPGSAGTTSIAPLTTSTLVTPGGQLPDNSQSYFRIRRL